MKTILITGSSGFIGIYLTSKFRFEYKIIGLDSKRIGNDKCNIFYNIDITDFDKVKEIFINHKIDYVIHLAAAKNLAWCEANTEKAYNINFKASKLLYELTSSQNGRFLFISSDQVFNGTKGDYEENTETNPINYYGILKDKVEKLIKNDINATICRTALVFGEIPENQVDYFDEIKSADHLIVQGYIVQHVIYKLFNEENINLPNNEFITPIYIELLCDQIKAVIKNDISGILHCCGGEKISRYDFGYKIAKAFYIDHKYILSDDSNDILRPKDVSLNFKKSMDKMGIRFIGISEMLEKIKFEIEKKNKEDR